MSAPLARDLLGVPTRLIALARFYAAGAAGVGLRNAIGSAMALILSLVIVPDVEIVIGDLAAALVGTGGRPAARIAFGALALAVTWRSGPLLRLGLGGWMRSAPVAGADHRRAMAAALVVPQLFLVALTLGALGLTWSAGRVAVDGAALASVVALIPLAAAAGVPVARRALGWTLAAIGVVATAQGGPWGIAVALAALVTWDRMSGPVVPDCPRPTTGSGGRWLPMLITWRALGPRSLAAVVPALLIVGVGYLYRVNNGFNADEALGAARLAATLGPAVTFGLLGDRLVETRSPWPWSRSLPWSAASRVGLDAGAFAIYALPTLLVAVLVDWRSAAAGLLALPMVSLLAVGAHRRASGRHLRATGELLVTGGAAAVAVGLFWGAAVALLVLAPVLWWHTARADRDLVATAWVDLHHGARGDSLAGDAR